MKPLSQYMADQSRKTSEETKGIEIDFLRVGDSTKSGDAILIRFGDLNQGKRNQHVILIDGGYASTAGDIKDLLEKHYNCKDSDGRYQIDLMILTHPDQDHVSGLVKLAEDDDVSVRRIMMHRPWEELYPEMFKDGRITERSLERRLREIFEGAHNLEKATSEAIRWKTKPGRYKFGDATIAILGPNPELYRECLAKCEKTPEPSYESLLKAFSQASDIDTEEPYVPGEEITWHYEEETSPINESSLVILLEVYNKRILFTGDAGKEAFGRILEYADENRIDLTDLNGIKMPHHGSRKNVTPEIMDDLGKKGTSCWITCAPDDEGHHPSKRLVNMLNQKGFKVYTTKDGGLCWNFNAPSRKGYGTSEPTPDYPSMEK